jgi:uncharacterized protein YjbJ (UPF0337 family)
MSDRSDETRDRVEGTVEKMKGRGKQAWGDLTGDEETRAEGQVDEAKGKAKQAWADAKEKARDLKEEVTR